MNRYGLLIFVGSMLLGNALCVAQADLSELQRKARAGDAAAQIQVGMHYAMTAHPDIP